MNTMPAWRDTKLYVSFNIPSQKHVIIHAHSILSSLVSMVHIYTHKSIHSCRELRLNWTLKGECQFHVKSLFLFLFGWVWDSSFSILTEPRAHLHLLRWRVRQYRYNMYLYILYMNWTWRLTEISRMLMQSLKKKKNIIIQYRYKYIYIYIYISSLKRWPSKGSYCTSMRVMIMIEEYSSLEIGIQEKSVMRQR
jgi:hypothetical protein